MSCSRHVGKYGVQCSGLVLSGKSQYGEGLTPPVNYNVSDIGKAGVPWLDRLSLTEVALVKTRARSSKLRFVVIPPRIGLVVFNATAGPCYAAPLYEALNLPGYHYQPGENPWGLYADPS